MLLPSLSQFVWVSLWLLIFGVCGFALWRGGPPERIGAGLVLLIALVGSVINTLPVESSRQVGHLIADGVLALGFLAVAVRYGSLWLGGAMLFQAAQFSLHAFFFVTQKPQNSFYGVVNNVNLFGVLICLLVGALAAHNRARARVRAV